ncbi:pyridoxamine 5'-phosphate oxidase family protein [Segetibacter sp. 3557_3]|uniref:pyridoxamine 5'-phosphate oxidase family protein n=1 Tax=Segetibacter sp. 3557_3 TaxID=2547429 RepID=UPI0010592039|nr:pyridoxamine 5'-phosphate oxidase family protein [Segetibacter sp. 3557_3]TDH28543.1 pyridoxamine 5'-phosphate oxidase family protein [Segetibacter sp. 3557_3]
MIGKLNSTEIEEVLRDQVIGRIGCHADQVTYIVPISYSYDGTFIFIHSKGGMKIDAMKKNPNVCFEVEAFENMANWRTVILWGTFEEITNAGDRNQAWQALLHRTLPQETSETVQLSRDLAKLVAASHESDGNVYRIRVAEKTGRFEDAQAIDIKLYN